MGAIEIEFTINNNAGLVPGQPIFLSGKAMNITNSTLLIPVTTFSTQVFLSTASGSQMLVWTGQVPVGNLATPLGEILLDFTFGPTEITALGLSASLDSLYRIGSSNSLQLSLGGGQMAPDWEPVVGSAPLTINPEPVGPSWVSWVN